MKSQAIRLFGRSTKCDKGQALGWRTVVSYLLPAGRECRWSTPGCRASCLGFTAGRMVMRGVRQAQVARTRRMRELVASEGLQGAAEAYVDDLPKRPTRLAVRINGTSDLPDLADAVAREMVRRGWMTAGARIYDYTKSFVAALSWVRYCTDVHRTFSLSEGEISWYQASRILSYGGNVAAVCESPAVAAAVAYALGAQGVINGDEHDARFLDPDERGTGLRGWLVALSPKGAARKDATGFVIRASALSRDLTFAPIHDILGSSTAENESI